MSLIFKKIYRLLKNGSPHSQPYLTYRNFLQKTTTQFTSGLFNLTVDFELGWSRARRGSGITTRAESLKRSRRLRLVLPEFLSWCDQFNIPVTFAVVAHAALASCKHQAPPVCQPQWLTEDWYALDPHTNEQTDPDYYGQELIKEIMTRSVPHEIASHSFSHLDLTDEAATAVVSDFEISESFRLLQVIDPALTTFVFPKNHPASLAKIKAAGYQIYRAGTNLPLGRDANGLVRFPVGLWLSPQAMTNADAIALLKIGQDQKCLVNFFCHLYEFATPIELHDWLWPVGKFLAAARQQKLLQPITMRLAAEYC